MGPLEQHPDSKLQVLHGHFRYPEISALQKQSAIKVICWLRDPAERVYSNYRFFMAGLKNPMRNPAQYELNKHRFGESLLEYASKPENQNRMCEFLNGCRLSDLYFFGLLEHFEEDLKRLAAKLDWPDVSTPYLNQLKAAPLSAEDREALLKLNSRDLELYQEACTLLNRNFL